MDDVEVARLLEEAVAARRIVTPETAEAVEEPLRRVAEAGAAAVEIGLRMLGEPDRDVRAVGCELLAECCNGREAPTGRIVRALVELEAGEADGEVHWSLAQALGATREPGAVPALAALAGHDDEDVRFQVACALPDAADGRRDDEVVETLIRLMGDPDPEVRNWATFGLGRKVDDDSTRIREALWAATDDPAHDVREEAACGLARRRDRRALPTIREFLAEEEPHVWVFEAAEALADPALLPLLEPFGRDGLETTFAACEPDQQKARFEAAHAFLELLQDAFDQDHPGRVARLSSDRLATGVVLSTDEDDDTVWSATAILDHTKNNAQRAVAWVLDRLTDRGTPPER